MIIKTKIELVGALLKIGPVNSTLAENSILHIELAKPERIKGRALLCVNDKPFAMDGFTFAVPDDALLDGANTLVLQITADGKEPRLYRSLEKLIISKDKLQEEEVKRLQSELEFYKQHYLTTCTELRESKVMLGHAMNEFNELKQKFAAELLNQGTELIELKKDIKALKNEPLI